MYLSFVINMLQGDEKSFDSSPVDTDLSSIRRCLSGKYHLLSYFEEILLLYCGGNTVIILWRKRERLRYDTYVLSSLEN